MGYYQEKKEVVIHTLKHFVATGTTFSFSVDNGNAPKIRGTGDCTVKYIYTRKCGTEETRQIIEDALKRYQIDCEIHIVTTTSAGANIMKQFGRESLIEIILYLNHVIYLEAADTFYKNQVPATPVASLSEDCYAEIVENKNSSDAEEDYYKTN